MGAFCIFGISRSICKAKADKQTPTRVREEGKPGEKARERVLSIEEWAVKRDEMAEQLFTEATRKVRVSPELDAPHFCLSWLQADPKNVREAVLMVRGPKHDKHGNPIKRNGVQVETWLEYAAECERLGIAPVKLEGLTA